MSKGVHARGYNASVLVDVSLGTNDRLRFIDVAGQFQGSDLAASIFASCSVLAGLCSFRRINAPYPDALTVNLDGIGINDRSSPSYRTC
ncbi:hypothetical protein O206_23550 [Ochrobactrum sp. EGD-AQ16]|nr:hypothetical protein O206_23550 [Ochrobactrum sp. EGD-AQ16]